MALRGTSSPNQRSGQSGLAWYYPNLASEQTLTLSSPDFSNEGTIPAGHAATRADGTNLSPALAWSPAPPDTAELLLVIEDPDALTSTPYIHCLALLDTSTTGLAHGALDATTPTSGVRLLRSAAGSGYLGPAPPKSHGPHRYAFQLFALATPLAAGSDGAALSTAAPREVLAAARDVLARGRLDGFYQRT